MTRLLATALLILALASACARRAPEGDSAAAHPMAARVDLDPEAAPATGADDQVLASSTASPASGVTLAVARPVTPEACRRACDNALDLTLADLPAGQTEMRREIVDKLTSECPEQCLERGTWISVECVARARKLVEIAGCPR